jgi:MerR family mercuric resistance operon transcriptional regulator
MMTIGQVARRVGCGVETIRFYERQGLIEQPSKPDAGYRRYPDETIERVRFIRRAQNLGFSLREIEELLSLRADPLADCADVRRRASAKLQEAERKIAELERICEALGRLISACPGQGALRACSILDAMGGDIGK